MPIRQNATFAVKRRLLEPFDPHRPDDFRKAIAIDMQHRDFKISLEFDCGGRRWRCTDVGTRTVIAIPLDHPEDSSWYSGPPYAVAEIVFDEDDMPACTLPEE